MPKEYNYSHFSTVNLITDFSKTIKGVGVPPGAQAPDFTLTQVDGPPWRLSDHLDRPVLLHFGSYS